MDATLRQAAATQQATGLRERREEGPASDPKLLKDPCREHSEFMYRRLVVSLICMPGTGCQINISGLFAGKYADSTMRLLAESATRAALELGFALNPRHVARSLARQTWSLFRMADFEPHSTQDTKNEATWMPPFLMGPQPKKISDKALVPSCLRG